MNLSSDFMPPAKPKTKRTTRPSGGGGKTIGVHVPSEKALAHLYRRMEAEYRSASEIMYLLLRSDMEQYEAQQNQSNN
jgi:hypothetical protein